MISRHPQAVTTIRDRSTFQALRRPAGSASRGPVAVTFVPPLPRTAVPAPAARVGYAVGRSCGNAVRRNRLRRRFRAAVRESAGTLAAGAYLVRADPAAAALPYRTLVEAVAGAMADAARIGGTGRVTAGRTAEDMEEPVR